MAEAHLLSYDRRHSHVRLLARLHHHQFHLGQVLVAQIRECCEVIFTSLLWITRAGVLHSETDAGAVHVRRGQLDNPQRVVSAGSL